MSLKKSVLTLLAACLTLAGTAVFAAEPQIDAQSAYLLDAGTNTELYAKNADRHMYPGGTTMIMTSILGVESGRLDNVLTIGDAASQLPSDVSRLGLYPGDKVTLRNALTGMMTVGGCDAAIDVAAALAPSQGDFVAQMNAKAAAIGTTNTHFANPTGLPDENHYSTAKDLAKIAAYGMKSADFRNLVNRTAFDMPYADNGSKHCETTNEFLSSGFAGANGIKTGVTNGGGPCLVASATQNGHTLIASILNSNDRAGDARALLQYGFDRLAGKTTAAASQPSVTAAVQDSEKDAAEAYTLRTAPAGQTLSEIAAEQQQAAQLARENQTK